MWVQTTTTFSFTNPEKFSTVTIEDDNIIEIVKVTDSNGNRWFEVPYLAQDTVLSFQKKMSSLRMKNKTRDKCLCKLIHYLNA